MGAFYTLPTSRSVFPAKGANTTTSVNVPNAGTQGDPFTIGLTTRVLGFLAPATIDGTDIFIEVQVAGDATWRRLHVAQSADFKFTFSASAFHRIAPELLAGVRAMRLVTGTAQTAQRTFLIVSEDMVS